MVCLLLFYSFDYIFVVTFPYHRLHTHSEPGPIRFSVRLAAESLVEVSQHTSGQEDVGHYFVISFCHPPFILELAFKLTCTSTVSEVVYCPHSDNLLLSVQLFISLLLEMSSAKVSHFHLCICTIPAVWCHHIHMNMYMYGQCIRCKVWVW